MRKIQDRWVISPRDVIAELECNHRLHLEWSVINELLPPAPREDSPELELLAEQGIVHERKLAQELKSKGSFIDVAPAGFAHDALLAAHEKTLTAISDGIETIYQATFFTNSFLGFADFLILVKDDSGQPL